VEKGGRMSIRGIAADYMVLDELEYIGAGRFREIFLVRSIDSLTEEDRRDKSNSRMDRDGDEEGRRGGDNF
jgi:hypothetical protein